MVPRIGVGNRSADRAHQTLQPVQPVGLGIESDPDRRPGAAKGIARLVRHGGQHPLDEQVVDIDTNVVMLEGEGGGPFERQTDRSACIPRAVAGAPREAVEERRPAFLQEREEGIPIRHDGLQGPGIEFTAAAEQVNQALVQDARQSLAPVVSPQQDAQQIGRPPDERGRDVEDVQQREVTGRVVSEPVRAVPHPCTVQGGEMAAVERGDHWTTEARKQLVQTERELPASAQQVPGQGGRQLVALGADHDHQIGCLAPAPQASPVPPILPIPPIRPIPPIPAGPESGFVSEAERHAVIEREYLESPLADGFEQRLLVQQPVRVGHQGERRDPRRELLQYPVAPVVHRVGPSVQGSEVTVESAIRESPAGSGSKFLG